MSDQPVSLASVLAGLPKRFASPDPSTLATIPKGGVNHIYMGHAEVTLALIEADPCWSWRPVGFDVDSGGPLIEQHPRRLVMWGYLTVCGVERLCVGTCEPNKGDPEKELIGDLLRNGAMRFGIGTKLWSKATDADPAGAGGQGFDRRRQQHEEPREATAGERLYDRLLSLADADVKAALKQLAAENHRKLTAAEFDADPKWLELVTATLEETK